MATLYLTVGLPGTGKTTAARRIEQERGALRLTKDEWMKALYGSDNPSAASDVVEGRLVQIGLRCVELGVDVVIDFGLWSRDERTALRQAGHDRGAEVVVLYFELDPAEQRHRIEGRQRDAPHQTWPMSEQELATWAAAFEAPSVAEQNGSEPIGPPPAGFATWAAWMDVRWPASLA